MPLTTPGAQLRRIDRRTLTQRVIPLRLMALVCARCGREMRPQHAARDWRTGDHIHNGHCPWQGSKETIGDHHKKGR